MSKQITLEMPDNIDCLLITYMQSIALGNINIGQKVIVNDGLHDGANIVIDTSKTDVYAKRGDTE